MAVKMLIIQQLYKLFFFHLGGSWGIFELPYFFSYKTEFFSLQNNPKNLDPSYKMDLDL